MNTEIDDKTDDQREREREWRLQEQARIDQQLGVAAEGSARALRYRLLARELERPLDAALPSNFPYVQSQRIQALVEERRRAGLRFERRLKWGFAAGYGVCMCLAAMVYRHDILGWLDVPAARHVLSNPWLPALLGCVGLAYALQARVWRRLTLKR